MKKFLNEWKYPFAMWIFFAVVDIISFGIVSERPVNAFALSVVFELIGVTVLWFFFLNANDYAQALDKSQASWEKEANEFRAAKDSNQKRMEVFKHLLCGGAAIVAHNTGNRFFYYRLLTQNAPFAVGNTTTSDVYARIEPSMVEIILMGVDKNIVGKLEVKLEPGMCIALWQSGVVYPFDWLEAQQREAIIMPTGIVHYLYTPTMITREPETA